MMSMLGLRGSGGSSSRQQKGEEAQGRPPRAAAAAPPPASAKALRFVYCDERGKFRMDPEAVAALQLVKGPLGVVSVCGRSRQGKSFILNQLLGRSNGFLVASTHRPCTKGLWMWSTPLNRIAPDGTDYNVLLLDTEGIDAYDQSGTYSTQIFSLAVLLSSMFVYNQMGGIDEAALDRLSLVTEMTKHIRVRASNTHPSAVELGQFSPIFVWLLRDFYFDLTEDGRRITPKEYLESALQPMIGTGKAVAAKNEIRDSIRALFPDRHCFSLVRPLNEERDLQRLDQILVENMRPEFRAGLDALTRFIFERARPKQMGSTVVTGPVLAGLTQSFLEALNAGAVPTIATSWQNVEESECRRAYDTAIEVYMKAFSKSAPLNEDHPENAHEAALEDALAAYNKEAVGAGVVRHKYEKLLTASSKKQFEDYRSRVLMEFELKCAKSVEIIDEKLRAACHSPAATLDQVLPILNGLLAEYEQSTSGPTKWKQLARFLQKSLEGPLLDLIKKWSDQISAENSNLKLKCRSLEDRLVHLGKQLDSSQQGAQDWKKRYEAATVDYNSSSEEYSMRYNDLQKNYNTLEDRFVNLSQQLEITQKDASKWRSKHESLILEQRIEKERITSELATLHSRCNAAEARLAAAREQTAAAKEEAVEWRRKHDAALKESHATVEKVTSMHEQYKKQTQAREDALRADLSSVIDVKEAELKDMHKKSQQHGHRMIELNAQVKDQELKIKQQEEELRTLRSELKKLQAVTDMTKSSNQVAMREIEILKQEKHYDEERLKVELKRREEAEENCKVVQKEAKRASEVAENARAEASVAEREKLEVQRLAVERLAIIERIERQVEVLTKEKWELSEDNERTRFSEQEAVSRVASLERRLEEREMEMEELLHSEHEQRANTVQVLESLLATERQAHTEASARAEALSLQLQATQGKFDALQQELTAVRLNEAALDAKLKGRDIETVGARSKRQIIDDGHGESVQNMELDSDLSGSRKKRSRVFGTENGSPSYSLSERETPTRLEDGKTLNDTKDPEEHLKFTVSKLKQELTKAGFGAELLQLRNPTKKDIVGLYEKLVLRK